jgi:pyruvate/2-oxoglutarate dehydrogenase complex dihydrolipoamide dehydrogenase (E3) component
MPAYDAIVIGTGQSGPALARRLVAAGRKVAIIERKLFGGTCVNTGCTPTKTLCERLCRPCCTPRSRLRRED